jgi:acetyltransferase-like isoleucine patch superfamily enzyme
LNSPRVERSGVSDASEGDGGGEEPTGTPSPGDGTADDGTPAARTGPAGRESGVGSRNPRHDRLESTPTPGPRNSLQYWTDARHPLRIVFNFVLVQLIKYSPILRVKTWLLRRLGAEVGSGVSLALSATPDVFWPELITIEDDAIVGYDATILCHEFLRDEYRTGEVVVGEGAMIGADAVLLPGVRVGANARVAANSLVTEDVPPGATVAGVPAEVVRPGEADADDERPE